MSAQLDHLTQSVAAETSADASAIALIQGLSTQLKACLAMDDSAASLAAIQTLASDLDANQAALAAAVAANQPPAPSSAPADGSAPAQPTSPADGAPAAPGDGSSPPSTPAA